MTSPLSEIPNIPSATVDVQYNVVNDGVNIARLKITVPKGSSAQNVMEVGANLDKRLRFRVKYYNEELGYFVNKIGTTANWPEPGPGHFWIMYVGWGSNLQLSPVSASNWIPPQNSTVEMRYEHRDSDYPPRPAH